MARSRSRSNSSSRRNTSVPAKRSAPPPAQQGAGAPKQPGMFSQMASIAGGVAVGNAVGGILGNGISSMFGGSSDEQPPMQQQSNFDSRNGTQSCDIQSKAFTDCMQNYNNDVTSCQYYLDMLKGCQAGSRF